MIKKIIKNWLGISKIEAEIRTLNHDVLGIMDKQLDGIMEDKFIKTQRKVLRNVKKIRSSSESRKLR